MINFLMNQNTQKEIRNSDFSSTQNFSSCNQMTMAGQDCRIGQLLFKYGFLVLDFALKCLNESKK